MCAKLLVVVSNTFLEQHRDYFPEFEFYSVNFQFLYTLYPTKPKTDLLCDETTGTLEAL